MTTSLTLMKVKTGTGRILNTAWDGVPPLRKHETPHSGALDLSALCHFLLQTSVEHPCAGYWA